MTLEETAELAVQWVGVEIDKDDVTGWMDANGQAIGKVANPLLIALSDDQSRGVVGGDSAAREVLDLLSRRRHPDALGVLENRVQQHQTLERAGHAGRSAEPAVGLADRLVDRPMTYVIDASPIVRAVVSRDEAEPHDVGEELPRLLAKDNAREARILAHEADAGVACDEHQEASLAVGESALRDRLNRMLEIHHNNSSAMRGSNGRPPLLPLVLAVMPRPPDPRRPPPDPRAPTTRAVPAL